MKSEHFTVRGDFEPEFLIAAAKNAERAVRVMRAACEGHSGFRTDPRQWPAPFTLQDGGRTDFLELDPGHFVRVAAGCKASELAA